MAFDFASRPGPSERASSSPQSGWFTEARTIFPSSDHARRIVFAFGNRADGTGAGLSGGDRRYLDEEVGIGKARLDGRAGRRVVFCDPGVPSFVHGGEPHYVGEVNGNADQVVLGDAGLGQRLIEAEQNFLGCILTDCPRVCSATWPARKIKFPTITASLQRSVMPIRSIMGSAPSIQSSADSRGSFAGADGLYDAHCDDAISPRSAISGHLMPSRKRTLTVGDTVAAQNPERSLSKSDS